MNLQTKLLGLGIAAALAIAGLLIWMSADTPTAEVPLTKGTDSIELGDPGEPTKAPSDKVREAEAGGRVQLPSTAAPEDDSAAALPNGRARAQIDAAAGVNFPAQFELLVERVGSPTQVFVFPGNQRLVTIDLGAGRSVLSARADGLASRLVVVERGPADPVPLMRFVLEPAGRVNGQVLDARGAGLAELPVSLLATNGRYGRTVTSDNDGRYSFGDVPVGSYHVAFGSPDSPIAPALAIDVVRTEVREIPAQNMPELGEGEVRVLDRSDRPVAGARVVGTGQRGGKFDGLTDDSGVLRARFLPEGTFFLNVTAPPRRNAQGALEINIGRIGSAEIRLPD